MKAPKILVPMEYFAKDMPDPRPRICAVASLSHPGSGTVYGRLRMPGRRLENGPKAFCFPLFDVHHQLHFGVDVAAHLESSRIRKAFGKILARCPLVGIEQSHDIDLMDE